MHTQHSQGMLGADVGPHPDLQRAGRTSAGLVLIAGGRLRLTGYGTWPTTCACSCAPRSGRLRPESSTSSSMSADGASAVRWGVRRASPKVGQHQRAAAPLDPLARSIAGIAFRPDGRMAAIAERRDGADHVLIVDCATWTVQRVRAASATARRWPSPLSTSGAREVLVPAPISAVCPRNPGPGERGLDRQRPRDRRGRHLADGT